MSIKVRVRNFQSIEDATIVVRGLTVLTGTNNAGKSALFRAVRGAFTNAPGHAFVRSGQPFCIVDLEFEDGQTLTWKKGKGINTYVVNGKTFDKVGRDVPPEVRIFGVDPIQVGDKDLWPQIAPQVTGVVFLLNESGSVIAEAVADVKRVNQLTSALKECESDRRAVRADLKVRAETASTLAEQRTSFAGLDVVVERLAELDKAHETGVRLEKAVVNLGRLATRFNAASADVAALQGIDDVVGLLPSEELVVEAARQRKEIEILRSLRDRVTAARETLESLDGLEKVSTCIPSEERVAHIAKFRQGIGITMDLVLRYDAAQEECERTEAAETVLAGISMDDDMVDRIQKFTKAVQTLRQFQGRYARALKEMSDIDAEVAASELQKTSIEAELGKLLGSSQECPTCGQGLGHLHG
jgi:hypothetical protein